MRRILSLVLAVAILFTFMVAGGMTVYADEESGQDQTTETTPEDTSLKMSDEGIEMIKSFEGFSKKPYWDVNQWTVGYGTYCPSDKLEEYKANGIPEEEADALLRGHVASYEKAVNYFSEKYDRELTQYEFDALVCFTYNLGSGWIYQSGNFRKTMADPNASDAEVIFWFGAYCSAGGSVLSGLIRRRLAEANLFLNGVYSTSRPSNYCYVKLNANGGDLKDSRINPYDINTTDRVEARVKYEGYTFEGWYTEKTGGTKVTFLDESHHGNTLYAHWSGDGKENDPDNSDEQQTIEAITVTVTNNDVNIRKGPGTNYTTIGQADKGDKLTITKIAVNGSRTWGGGEDGWICLEYTNYEDMINGTQPEEPEEKPEETPEETTPAVMGTVKVSSSLTIRKGPGTGYASAGSLKNKTRVEILEQKVVGSMTWGRIEKGWISLKYVELDEEQEGTADQTPVEPPKEEEPEQTPDQTPEEPPKVEEPDETPEEPPKDEEPDETPEEPPKEEKPENTTVTGTVKVSSSLTIRKGPGTSYGVAGSYKNGARVTITEQKDVGSTTWGKTNKGWISLNYVVLDQDKENDDSTAAPDNGNDKEDTEDNSKRITGTVDVSDVLRIRSGPGTSYSVAGYYRDGDKVTIIEQKVVGSTTWGKTDKGWISLAYVDLDQEAEAPEADIRTVTASCLKVRKNAGTSYSVVDYLYKGDKVEILETKKVNGTIWGRIATGWISLDYAK